MPDLRKTYSLVLVFLIQGQMPKKGRKPKVCKEIVKNAWTRRPFAFPSFYPRTHTRPRDY